MLRTSARTTVPEGQEVPELRKPLTHEELVEERLDLILGYMARADRRDRWRTLGGFFRSILTLLPVLFFLGSAWYVYLHGTDLLNVIIDRSAKSAASYSQQSTQGVVNQFKGFFLGGSSSSRK